jgi:hypothetical protein
MAFYFPNTMCIFIASHISNLRRLGLLKECLQSLCNQTVPIAVFLSISFETDDLKGAFVECPTDRLTILVQEERTPQMRHIELLYKHIENSQYEWILFSDDDDTYKPNRVEQFAEVLVCNYGKLVGIYESVDQKNHRMARHEFWCYCVHRAMLGRFFERIRPFPDIRDNKCCDVLFGEYLRRSLVGDFASITMPLYNYRVENNSDSITGQIKVTQGKYTVQNVPPETVGSDEWLEYVENWNQDLYETMPVYLHDVYLRTLCGVELKDVIVAEFRLNASLIHLVDGCHYTRIKELYERVRDACGILYDVPL